MLPLQAELSFLKVLGYYTRSPVSPAETEDVEEKGPAGVSWSQPSLHLPSTTAPTYLNAPYWMCSPTRALQYLMELQNKP